MTTKESDVFLPYECESVPEALTAYDRYRRERNPRWSTRSWAKRSGFRSGGALGNILKGRRLPDWESLESILATMDLTWKAADFFRALLERDLLRREGRPIEVHLLRRIQVLRRFHDVPMLGRDEMNYVGSLLSHLICTMAGLANFREDPGWIRSQVRIEASEVEIEATVKALIYVGLLSRRDDGRLVNAHAFYETPEKVATKKARECFVDALEMAKSAVHGLAPEERFLNWQMFTLRKERYAEAAEYVRQFRQEFTALFSEDVPEADSVYMLNLQLFPLTRRSGS